MYALKVIGSLLFSLFVIGIHALMFGAIVANFFWNEEVKIIIKRIFFFAWLILSMIMSTNIGNF